MNDQWNFDQDPHDDNLNNDQTTPGGYDYYQVSSAQEPDPAQEPVRSPEPAGWEPEKKQSSTGKKFGLCIALALVFGLIAGGTFWGVNTLGDMLSGKDKQSGSTSASTTTTIEPNTSTASSGSSIASTTTASGVDDASSDGTAAASSSNTPKVTAGTYTVSQVAENCMPSIVAITNMGVEEVQDWFGGTRQYESESTGSGIIVGQNATELLVATNNHVVSGANTLSVAFIDDEVASAQIKGNDEENDLAIIAVKISDMKEATLKKIKVATLGSSDNLVVGEQVVAIGNALGYGQSVTSGYVSALNREVTLDNYTSKLIQTDAAINPGNSGGALIDMKGEVIGINSVKYASSEVEGMGYAIPITTAEPTLNDLMNKETRYKVDDDKAAYIGIKCMDVPSETAAMYDMPEGIYVSEATPNGPAEKAGLQKGDIITELDGNKITSYEVLVEKLAYYAAGEKVAVTYSRANGGKYETNKVTLTLGNKKDMPSDSTDSSDKSDSGDSGSPSDGGIDGGTMPFQIPGDGGDNGDDGFSLTP